MRGHCRGPRRVGPLGQPDAERERRRGIEAGIERAQVLEAADHQTRGDQEHQRQRNLASHQQLARPVAAAARRVPGPTSCSEAASAAPRHNGMEPNASAASRLSANVKANATLSRRISWRRGSVAGPTDEQTHRAGGEDQADGTPAADSRMLSVRKKRAMPPRSRRAPAARRLRADAPPSAPETGSRRWHRRPAARNRRRQAGSRARAKRRRPSLPSA